MPILKYIAMIVMLIVFQHSLATRANSEELSTTAMTTQQQEPQTSREQPSDTEKQATAPLVETIQSSPSDTSLKSGAADLETGFIDALHGAISQQLLTTAIWLDSFFSDDRYIKEDNRSYIRARYDFFKEEKSSPTFKPTFDIRLALPQLEKKAHIVVSAEPAETPATTPVPPSATTERIGTTEERNVTTAVQYVLRATAEQNFTVRSGAQFTHGSPALFIAPRYRFFSPLTTWDFRFTQEVIWNTVTRSEANTVFDLERKLPRDLFFRTSVGGAWIETSRGYFYGLSFSLRQPFDSKHAIDYEWTNSFQTRPVGELLEVLFRVRYRQSFWREWFFFEVAPQYRFPRDRDFTGTPGILFRLEMFFGRVA
jgi:hypothetical protein